MSRLGHGLKDNCDRPYLRVLLTCEKEGFEGSAADSGQAADLIEKHAADQQLGVAGERDVTYK